MAWSTSTLFLATSLVFLFCASPAHAFGAGNIASLSKIEGQNWRHGDIEDVLLTLAMARSAGGRKFTKLDVQRVYFGNWLRDYSQAIDVGTVKYVSAEAIRILLWVLGFMSFGLGTGEFEVTTERLGCYQPTEHIDNPLGYAEGDDARRYDRRLRGPVDARRELSIDQRIGLKHYIASEDVGIDTSAGFVRKTLGQCIEFGRRYSRSGDKADLYEALRLMGTGLHCLEDFTAHSNYTELSLMEMGERDVFPMVGRNTMIQLPGSQNPVYPIITGSFGGVDFLHSVVGEISDKATQSELQDLEGVIAESQQEGPSESFLQQLLDKLPSEMFGGGSTDNTGKMDEFEANAQAQQQQGQASPREPEEWAKYLINVHQQLYPVLEWHDNLVKQISAAIEKIPALPDMVEQVQDQITLFVYKIMAPYVLPILQQVKDELETGSSEVIQGSKEQQHNVFHDDSCSDPTHSMLSKDHFSNVLNEPAGKISHEVVRWAVPQIMELWDDTRADPERTLTRIIYGVLHHPAQRTYGDDGISEMRQTMFRVVEDWWGQQGDAGRRSLRQQLSKNGVQNGENHKQGVHDSGHGCGKPMSASKKGKGKKGSGQTGGFDTGDIGKLAQGAVGGGALGGLVGSFFGEEKEEKKKDRGEEKEYKKKYKEDDDEKRYKKKYKDDEDEKKHKKKYKDDDDDHEKKDKKKDKDDDDKKKYKKKYKHGDDDDDGDSGDEKKYKKKHKDDDDKKHKKKKSKDYDEEKKYKKKHKDYDDSYGQHRSYGGRHERSKSRSRSRGSDRQSRNYHSSHYGGGDHYRRHGSEERDSDGGGSYRKRYDDDYDDHRRRHHQQHHHH